MLKLENNAYDVDAILITRYYNDLGNLDDYDILIQTNIHMPGNRTEEINRKKIK